MAWFFNLLKSNFHSRGLACFSLFSCAFLPLFPSLSFSSYRPPPVFGSTSPIPYSTAALLWAFLFHMLAGLFLFFFFSFPGDTFWRGIMGSQNIAERNEFMWQIKMARQKGKSIPDNWIDLRYSQEDGWITRANTSQSFWAQGMSMPGNLRKGGEKMKGKTGNLPIHPLLLLNKWFKVQFLAPASLFSHFYPTLSTLKWRWRRRELSLTMILTPLNMTPGSVGK